jgi:RNA polymerase sigma-70 factor, ECF subfamily
MAETIPVQSDSDAELPLVLSRAAGGDESAWRRLIDLFARRVFALAKSRCRDAGLAEEITQSVFATVASKLPTGDYAEQGRFESWIFRITMNRLRDEMRRVRRQAVPTGPEGFAGMPGNQGGAGTGAGEDLEPELVRLRAALETLPAQDREIVELRHHGGLSFKQLAELLEEPLGTLLARHHRALKKLHAVLSAETDGTDDEKMRGGEP